MKNKTKKTLRKRGIVSAGRAQNAPTAIFHEDKRRVKRSELKRTLRLETARVRGPFSFLSRISPRFQIPGVSNSNP